jgi:hypothetical protein
MELKVTKEKVLEAASKCSTAREVLKTLFPQAFAVEFNETRIYAFVSGGVVYKLHRREEDSWGWVHMGDSRCFANGEFDSPQEALIAVHRFPWKEFVRSRDFFEWALKQV